MLVSALKYHPVNWVDGMKIARRHLTDWENFMHDQIRDSHAVGLSPYRFGILPAERSLDVQLQCDYNQQIKVRLQTCRAITPNGCRIEYVDSEPLLFTTSFQQLAETYSLGSGQPHQLDVILTTNPFNRIPAGEPLLYETPPRHPFTLPEYRLYIMPSSQVRAEDLSQQLIVGRLQYSNGELRAVSEYIPACLSVRSLPAMQQWYQQFGKHLETLETNAFKILQKSREKDPRNALMTGTQMLAERIAFSLADISTYFEWLVLDEPPINMAEVLLRPVQCTRTVMNCLNSREKEEFVGYLSEWADLTPGAFESQLNAALQLTYKHTEIASVLTAIDAFYRVLTTVFYKLAQLDFIGKRKGQNVFIIEHEVKETPPEKPRTRWSPLG